MTTMRMSVRIAVLSFAALFARAAWQVPRDWSGEWELETTMLAASSVYHKKQYGPGAPMGYPFTLDAKRPVWKSEVFEPYLRQMGLIPTVLSIIAPREEAAMNRFLLASRYGFAALACAAAAALIAVIAAEAGVIAATGALVVTLGSWHFADFARSAYWALFLPLSVVAWSWFMVTRAKTNRLRARDVIILGFLVFLDSLAGYEYVSTLLMMPLAVVGYVAVARAVPWRDLARMTVELSLAAFSGFVAAFAAHGVFLWTTMGRQQALDNTVANAWRRSVGQATPLGDQLFGIYGVFAHDKYLTALLFFWAVCLVAVAATRRSVATSVRGLAVASVIAAVAAATWLVLARTHTALAPGINMIPFYYGATMLMGAFMAEWVVTGLRRLKPGSGAAVT